MAKNKMYPSQERYIAKNPVVSFRLTKEDKEKLEDIAERENTTVGQYVRDFLKGIIEERETEMDIYTEGANDGYEKGKEDWQIWFDCNVCGEPCAIKPGSKAHKEIIKHLENWGHEECIDKQKEESNKS